MARRQRFWLYEAYLALANEGGRTEPQGRQLLKDTFPTISNLVDPVIAAQGRIEDVESALIEEWTDTAHEQEATLAGDDFNARIRQQVSREIDPDGDDMNAALRKALGRGSAQAA